MSSLVSNIAIELLFSPIRAAFLVYDIVTFPVYFLVQRPFTKWPRILRQRGTLESSDSGPSGTWTSTLKLKGTDYDACHSYPDMMTLAMKKYASRNCYGRRVVFEEFETDSPDGKKIKKKVLDSKYTWMTFSEVDQQIDSIVNGLVALGVRRGDKVVLMMETRAEWPMFAQALLRMGAVLCTMYPTLGQNGIVHGINELEAALVITSAELEGLLQTIANQIKKVNCVVVVDSKKKRDSNDNLNIFRFVSMEELIVNGQATPQAPQQIAIAPDDLALIMYTSGSSGVPKGVMLSHKNLVSAFKYIHSAFFEFEWGKKSNESIYMAYLPLGHIFEFVLEMTSTLYGCSIGYATPLTIMDTSLGLAKGCSGDATVLRPSALITVPLVLDKIRTAVRSQITAKGLFFTKLFDFAINYKTFWAAYGFRTPLMNRTLFKKTKALLGGRAVQVVVGSAPLSPETQKFARAVLDLELLQGYGATEGSCVTTVMDMNDHDIGTVGQMFAGLKVRLAEWTEAGYSPLDSPNPRGEICIGGENIALGYFKRDTETGEAFEVDKDGTRWFISGDIGEITARGTLKVIDRKKDLIKLQNGEYVSLGKVEAALKSCLYIENVCVFGDSLTNFIVALILPNRLNLTALAKTISKGDLTWTELCNDTEIKKKVLNQLRTAGREGGLGTKELPKRIKLCSDDWTPASELVTATLKIRRKFIFNFYKSSIEKLCT